METGRGHYWLERGRTKCGSDPGWGRTSCDRLHWILTPVLGEIAGIDLSSSNPFSKSTQALCNVRVNEEKNIGKLKQNS